MASAYTPGLTVSGDTVVRRVRRLPIKGEVLVAAGDRVTPQQVVARAMLPGAIQTIRMAERLGVDPKDVPGIFGLGVGDPIEREQLVAETRALFGLIRNRVVSDYAGTVEAVSDVTGNVLVREASIPVDIRAYIEGTVADVLPGEGAVVETRAAMVQGIFGVGGERQGRIRLAVSDSSQPLEASAITDADAGAILVGGSGVTLDAIRRAEAVGATGIVAGGIRDRDLIDYLGYDIGVAITGGEAIGLTVLVTEGFGDLAMAARTFELLRTLKGRSASINGATQIRAGVIRPEVIVPLEAGTAPTSHANEIYELREGAPIRIVREPYFGRLGTVTELPPQLVTLESGTEVRVLRARLQDGEEVTVPRANVEIIAAG